MAEPDFSYENIDESEAFTLRDGESVIQSIRRFVETGVFDDLKFVVRDENGNEYFLECIAFTTLERFGKERLYFAVKNLEEEKDSWYTYYILQREDGQYLLVHETDDEMFNAFQQEIESMREAENTQTQESGKKKSKGWHIAFAIILFPFWLIWQFIKALISLFGIATSGDGFVKGFKRGYGGGESEVKEYTYTNSMGCTQTVYSSNGRDFYSADGSYVGSSNDNGKTIIED